MSGTHALPTSALTINGSATSATATTRPAATSAAGSTAPATDSTTYPYAVPAAGTTAPTATVAYTTAAASGMGTNNLASDWWLAIPASAHAGTYTNTITLSIVSGP